MNYNLELDKAVSQIQQENAKIVCIQLPDYLKQFADKIQKELESKTQATIIIWLGSCFGACDIPNVKADLLIQWGHSEMRYL